MLYNRISTIHRRKIQQDADIICSLLIVGLSSVPKFGLTYVNFVVGHTCYCNLLKPTGYVMHQQFNIQQLYVLPTLYLYVLYLSENKQRIVPLTA